MTGNRVYVAGPLTQGDQMVNVRAALDAGQKLRNMGFFPYIPHLSVYWHVVHHDSYERWMELDFEWVRACHALLRLPGESAGADREVALAREIGIPVFTKVADVAQARRAARAIAVVDAVLA